MKYNLNFIVICILMIVVLACNHDSDSVIYFDEDNTNYPDKYCFEIYDTIHYDINQTDSYLPVFDYLPSKQYVFFYSFYSNSILIADLNGKVISQFNAQGNGPDKYSMVHGLSFFNDSTIIVCDRQHLKAYTISGDFLFDKYVDNSKMNIKSFSIQKYTDGNRVLYLLGRPIGSLLEDNLFDKILYTEVNMTDTSKNICTKIKLNADNNYDYYEKNGKFMMEYSWFCDVNQADKIIYVAFDSDPVIYKFDYEGNSMGKFQLYFDNFKKLYVMPMKYANSSNRNEFFKWGLHSNGNIYPIHVSDSLMLIQYRTPLNESMMYPVGKKIDTINYFWHKKSYCNVLINEKKVCNDILLEDNNGNELVLRYLQNKDTVLFQPIIRNKSENEPSIIYLARLKKVEGE